MKNLFKSVGSRKDHNEVLKLTIYGPAEIMVALKRFEESNPEFDWIKEKIFMIKKERVVGKLFEYCIYIEEVENE